MKRFLTLLFACLLAACGSKPPVPDWQMNAHAAAQRATSAYLEGNTRVEALEWQRARAEVARTGDLALMARLELMRCATRVAALVFEPCTDYDALRADAAPAEQAYAAYLAGTPVLADVALLPALHQGVAQALAADQPADAALVAMSAGDALARLIATGVVLNSQGGAGLRPATLAIAIDTAAAQGWRRPLLAWLGVERRLAQERGDATSAALAQRRMNLIERGGSR